ncbi:MAG: flagellar biosynthesis protein FlhA [Defluviitaleaceae bacterium]|nr:flagellar biosynthesis protein FlhA [Defluviitaleaceae bacterium]
MKFRELSLGIFIIVVLLVFIIPPPSQMMDFILMINIAIGLIILLNAVYATEPLQMSTFPTILLTSILFRLAITISTTRLILGTGHGGQVIDTFGNFVAGGNLVLGVIIFFILTLINFMVITKGAERVAEVGARFTLDAMPGKQMAIDADLNAGLIGEDEAKKRRKKIQDESSFYGAMDGAAKFVKGEAIAGIIITFVNIIGGIIMGTTGLATGESMSIGEATSLFMMLSIGDGIVNMLPALLTSAATGFIVTKSTSEGDITTTLTKQVFTMPIVLILAGSALIFLGVFTPLPGLVFIPVGVVLVVMSQIQSRRLAVEEVKEEISAEEIETAEIRKPENIVSLLNVDQILLLFGYGLIPLADPAQGGDLLDRIVMIRRQIALELGVIVPVIHLRDDIKLSPNQYRILIKGVEVAGGDIMFDHYMAMNPGYVEEEIDGIETVEPYLGLPALWISETQRERAEALGYTVVDPPAIIATHMTEIIRSHLHELLSRQDVQTLIDNVKDQNQVLVDELIPRMMTIGDVQKVLANLLHEGISIRDLVTILDTLANYAHVTRDTDMLSEYVRQALRRSISRKFFDDRINNVLTLDPELEQRIMGSVQATEQGSYVALDPSTTQRIFDNLHSETQKLTSMGLQPIILTSPIVRIYFKRLVEQVAPDLVVLSYNEIDPKAEIQSIGMVSMT